MKNLILTAICIFIYICSFAQFSGGTGTISDPYLIGDFNDWYEMIEQGSNNYVQPTNPVHYRLVSDINIEPYRIPSLHTYFNGVVHGGGHTLFLPDSIDVDILQQLPSQILYIFGYLAGGYVDSIKTVGNLSYMFVLAGSVGVSTSPVGGEIYGYVNEANVSLSGEYAPEINSIIALSNEYNGRIVNCTNYGNIIVQSDVDNEYYENGWFECMGMVQYNMGEIIGCKNYGDIVGFFGAGGICSVNNGTIRRCINYGDIIAPADVVPFSAYPCGGIYALSDPYDNNPPSITEECINYGFIDAGKLYNGGGIVGGGSPAFFQDEPDNIIYHNYNEERIIRCANYGRVAGGGFVGGIVGYIYSISNVSSCFNAGQVARATNSGGIVGNAFDTIRIANNLDVSGFPVTLGRWYVTGDSISNMSSNYYDRQMSGGAGEDIEGESEGRFTSQLTGDTPELRAMLGDGWSYAEGRYPIPLGLENDSLAMLFATPIYLREISDDNYDHTNLVRNNFTVGTENGVSWSSGNRLSIDGENATILASGSEVATASLAGYSFTRSLRLDPITGELVATDCDSYLWNGNEYTASGDYIQVLTASNGCDSIVTLHLTINNSVHYSFSESATSPYIWNGTEYTETGDYTQTFTAENGCDSIVTLHLNILSGISDIDDSAITVYPNPIGNTLYINAEEPISEIEIVNTLGQIVYRKEVNADNVVCDVEGLSNGIYVVRIRPIGFAQGTAIVQNKFVKE